MMYADIMNFNLFACVCLFYTQDSVFSSKTRCSRTSSSGEPIWYCCDNHVEQNGTCVECTPGFESVNGAPCTMCLPGSYGRKCGEVCHMCKKERCHHAIGCVISTNRPVSIIHQDVKFITTEKIFTLPTVLLRILSTVSKDDETAIFPGLNRREIIIYSISAGFVSFVMLFCGILLRRSKQRNVNTRHFSNVSSAEQVPNDADEPVILASIGGGDGVYETIDESSIPYIPITMPARNQSDESSDSSLEENSDPLPNDDYLNPYQPIIEQFEKHEYTSIIERRDSDCSTLDECDEGSGYLNPYQMIIPDQDSHEYYKVNDGFCEGHNKESDFATQGLVVTYSDVHSYTSSTDTGHGENENETLYSIEYKDSWDMVKNVQTSINVAENEMNHNKNQLTCDIELKLCMNEYPDSSEQLEVVNQYHEIRG